MDSNKIERKGVRAVEEYLDNANNTNSFFTTNDKGPSWDGFFCIYEGCEYNSKDHLICRVPVQIKTSDYSTKQIPEHPKFPIEVSDLKNYEHEGGVVFFYALVSDTGSSLFCKILWRRQIKELLLKAEGQITISVPMDPVPHSINDFIEEVRKFDLQKTQKVIRLEEFEDLSKNPKYVCTCVSFNPQGQDEIQIATHPQMIMATAIDTGETYYSDKETRVNVNIVKYEKVKVGGKEYFPNYTKFCNDKESQYKIGGFIVLSDSYENKGKSSKSIKIEVDIHPQYIKDAVLELSFMSDFLRTGVISIGIRKYVFPSLAQSEDFQKTRAFYEKYISFWKDAEKLFDMLSVKDDLLLHDVDTDSERNLAVLIESILYNDIVTTEDEVLPFCMLNVGNLRILVSSRSLGNNQYRLYNAFKDEDLTCQEEYFSQYYPVPIYSFIFTRFDVLPSNIDYEQLLPSYEKLAKDNKYIPDRAYYDVQAMLLHWDKAPNNTLLEYALKLQEWINEQTKCSSELLPLNVVSEFQILLRRDGTLCQQQKQKLLELSETVSKKSVKFAISILLGEVDRAKMYFESLSPTEKKEQMELPIYNLYNKVN
jgi:hypothetical protein